MTGLQPVLFANDASWVRRGLEGGITTMIVDWENKGKAGRQLDRDTEVNHDTPEDLRRLRDLGVPRRLVRINQWGPWTPGEIETACAAGATDLLLPMVRTAAEVESVLALAAGRLDVGILVETEAAVRIAPELGRLPLGMVYVGLNDLAIDRGSAGIFEAVADGTVERIRDSFETIPFGFGGITVVDRGSPVPFRLLLAEMARLRCDFSFCRRSFKRDTRDRDIRGEMRRIDEEWRRLLDRPECQATEDRRSFRRIVESLQSGTANHA